MSTMKDIAKILSERNNISRQDADQFVAAFFDQLKIGLTADEQVKVKGLGTFKIQTMRPRVSVNVNTGERVVIDSHDRISFTPDKAMAEAVNRPFAHFETVVLNDGVVFEDIEDATVAAEEDDAPVVEEKPVFETQKPVIETPKPAEPVIRIVEPDDTPEPAEPEEAAPIVVPAQPVKVEESVKVEEPVKIEEPVKTEEPVVTAQSVESVPEVKPAEPAPAVAETPAEATGDNTPDVEEETTEHKTNIWLTVLLSVLFLIVGIAIGRITSDVTVDDIKAMVSSPKATETPAVQPVKKEAPVKPKPATPAVAVKDSVAKDSVPKVATPKPVKEKEDAQPEVDLKQYDSDARVRTGAYAIVGVKEVITVQNGMTLAAISKAYLGPGMECYVEAINGITEVKPGQKVKIPEVKLKKLLLKKK